MTKLPFFLHATAPTDTSTLSLHDALPISLCPPRAPTRRPSTRCARMARLRDTRLAAHRRTLRAFIRAQDRPRGPPRSEEHTSELQSQSNLVCRLLLEKKKKTPPSPSSSRTTPHLPSRRLPNDATLRPSRPPPTSPTT